MKFFSDNLSLTKMPVFPAKMTEKHFGTAFDIIVMSAHPWRKRSLTYDNITTMEQGWLFIQRWI